MRSKQPTVVIADSEATIRATLATIFKMFGLRGLPAASMREAASLIVQNDPDVVLTEDLLGDGDGCDLCRQFKVNGFWKALPFIMYAGHEIPADRLFNAGIDLFLPKPVAPRLLIDSIKELAANYTAYKQNLPRPPFRRRPRNTTPYVVEVARFTTVELWGGNSPGPEYVSPARRAGWIGRFDSNGQRRRRKEGHLN